MGAYINPKNETKEDFLFREGIEITQQEAENGNYPGVMVVCLVDNGIFKAAGVAFNQSEINEFAAPDGRSKRWFWVELEKLLEVSDVRRYKEYWDIPEGV